MAVSIDTVYQKVLAICNKEQRGYITPQEFNLLADRAQYEIYQNYFNEIKNAERKPKNQQRFSDTVEQVEEKLQVFKRQQDESFGLTSGGAQIGANTLTINSNCYKIISVERRHGAEDSGNIFLPVEIVSRRELAYILSNPLTAPSVKRSIAVRTVDDDNDLNFFPANDSTGSAFTTYYYTSPSKPNWTYVIVNEQALYNASAPDASDFQLHSSEEETLVTKILQLAGVMIKQPDIQQAAINSYQMYNQEKNS